MNNYQRRKRCLFFILVLCIIPAGALHGREHHIIENREMIVLFPESLQTAAEETANIFPIIRKELEDILEWKLYFRPTVILVENGGSFQKMAGSPLTVAFAMPEKNLIVIDHSKMKIDPFSIEKTLKHELCHLLLHEYIKGGRLPRWLDEGIAQWVSGGMAEIMINQKKSLLHEAILKGKVIRVMDLKNSFPREKKSLIIAYESSKSFVEYILKEYGTGGILLILEQLKEGDEADAAISKALSITPDELESDWQNHIRKKLTWATYLINHLYEILFFLAAIIMIFGFFKRVIQKRAYGLEEEDVDGW